MLLSYYDNMLTNIFGGGGGGPFYVIMITIVHFLLLICSYQNFLRYGTDLNSMVIEDVSCSTSNYLVLLQCDVSSQYSTYCNNNNRDVVVTCCEYMCIVNIIKQGHIFIIHRA